MATILAANTGNWSATGTWTGGVVPVAGDIVVANGKTVTMDTLTVTVAELRNDTTGGAVAGGTFNLVNGSNVTANIYAGSTGSHCVLWSGTVGQTATVTGNFFGGSGNGSALSCQTANLVIGGGSTVYGGTVSTNGSYGIGFLSSGTFTFCTPANPGNIYGGTTNQSGGPGVLFNTANSNVTIYANTIAAQNSGAAYALYFTGASQTVNIIAANIGATTATVYAIYAGGSLANHTYTVSGSITAGVFNAIHVASTGTYSITVSGSISGGTGSGARGISNENLAIVNIVGNITNNVSVNNGVNYSVLNAGGGTINITGTATAGNLQGTALNNSTGILRCTRAKGNGYGAGSAGINNVQAVVSAAQGSLTYIEELEFGSLGNTPVSGPIRLTALTTNKAIVTTTTGSFKTLVDTAATSGILPDVTDVRSGIVYSSGNLTGTCAVPGSGSVALGVPVDNTVGTAVLTAANLRTALGMASANLDTQLDLVPTASENAGAVRSELTSELARASNCATVATTGQQIQDALI